ncbi:MAG: DUF1178 family protein [Deltaproteobacteria bacterium]|nr:DUF1178 family protein [Deltaproteobacteria bacterium]
MIIYDLKCQRGHKFEGWFKDRAAFEKQKAKKLVACPVCGGTDVIMVPSSVTIMGKDSQPVGERMKAAGSPQKVLNELKDYIRQNFDDVGDKFADVALRIHHGEEDRRNIRGTTTQSEEETLRDEGVQFVKLALPEFDA